MKMEEKERNWTSIGLGTLVAILAALGIFLFSKYSEEQKTRIEAQNRIAEQSEVIRESQTAWSRLATQYEDLDSRLNEINEDLTEQITRRGEEITAFSSALAKIRPVVIRFPAESVTQEPEGDSRIRVSFDETQDPMRIHGWTLTNPAEAEVSVEFTRPLRLTSVITQRPDGSWNSYFDSDWENLEIQELSTVVNPLPERQEAIRRGFIVGLSARMGVVRPIDSVGADLSLLYETGTERKFTVGPTVGFSTVNGSTRLQVGVATQWRLWGR